MNETRITPTNCPCWWTCTLREPCHNHCFQLPFLGVKSLSLCVYVISIKIEEVSFSIREVINHIMHTTHAVLMKSQCSCQSLSLSLSLEAPLNQRYSFINVIAACPGHCHLHQSEKANILRYLDAYKHV